MEAHQLGVDVPHGAALHRLQQLLQLAEGQLGELQLVQVLSVEQSPPQVVSAAVAHGLLHAGLDLSTGRQHLVVEQREQRAGVQQPLGLSPAPRQRVELVSVAGSGGGFRRCFLPEILLGSRETAGLCLVCGEPAPQLRGVPGDLRKLLEAPHVGSEAGEELSLTRHDHVEPQPVYEGT